MVSHAAPQRRSPKNPAATLVGTDQASRSLRIPGRTVRRWVQQRGLGVMVAGRRVLTAEDVRQLTLLRDGAAG